MGGFGRGCDRLWVGGQGGLVAHLVLALELWLARLLAGMSWRIDPMCWVLAGRQAGREGGRGTRGGGGLRARQREVESPGCRSAAR